MKHSDNTFIKAVKFVKTCHEKYLNDEFVDEERAKRSFVRVGEE